ncbi:MAG TPA: RNA polymerase sigma-70 factor [Solirubrobacteraceae bacterium]|nr:RNA polymerase sigma-70 factor [Solirubrobacteraceae bacterium]
MSASPYAELRPRLVGIAYRMLGSVGEAEDLAQEALLRLHDATRRGEEIASPAGWLVAVTTRLAIDELRSARVRREAYAGPWLPEPLVAGGDDEAATRVELDETVSMAFLVLLERLGPVERAVFVLREAFAYGYDEIAAIVGRSEDACRQLLSRARRRIADERPRFEPSRERREELARRFLDAARDGELAGLVELLAADATFVGDGGGKATAVPRPLHGAERVARLVLGLVRRGARMGVELRFAEVNGQPGIVAFDPGGRVISAMSIEIAGGAVVAIRSVVNPDKLAHLGPVSDLARLDRVT